MKSVLFKIKIDENLSLIIPHLGCAPEIFSLIDKDRDHLRAWLPWVDSTTTAEDTRKNISDRIEGFEKKEQASFYGILNGKFVASVGFISLNDNDGEIGYWLLSEYGGRGLMTTFVKACIDYGFDKLKLSKIVSNAPKETSKAQQSQKGLASRKVKKLKRNASETAASTAPSSLHLIGMIGESNSNYPTTGIPCLQWGSFFSSEILISQNF